MKLDLNNRILIVDDNAEIHEDFKKILAKRTEHAQNNMEALDSLMFNDTTSTSKIDFPIFELDTALQGQEALQKVEQAVKDGRPYALAFIDMRMPPGWDGLETIKHLWAADPLLQTVICTAYSDYSWEEILNVLGHSDRLLILKKPFDNIEIRLLALALTRKWTLSQQASLKLNDLQDVVVQQNESLANSLSLTNATLESVAEGILVFNLEQKVVLHNENCVKMWGIPLDLLNTGTITDVIGFINKKIKSTQNIPADLQKIIADKYFGKFAELELLNGKYYELCIRPQYKNSDITGLVYSFRDISLHKELEAELAKQATFDNLTGLPNRSLLVDRIQQAITYARRNNQYVAILFVDLDSFKAINDTLGHEVGDQLLKEFALRLKECLRATDTIVRIKDDAEINSVARLGGDEFVIVLTMINAGLEGVNTALSRLTAALCKPYNLAGHELILTMSIGISMYPQDAEDPITLMKHADIAMYRAKEEGKGRYEFYHSEMSKTSMARMELEKDLRYAIERNELFLNYQPLVNVTSHNVVSLEVLVRWKHPTLGLIPPLSFIPIAEATGLIIPIGLWILKTACAQNKAWQDAGLSKISVAVNMSGYQFKQGNLIDLVKNVLLETGLEGQYLELELTESVLMSNVGDVSDKINTLKEMGVKCNIDDFGTGYSSLNYINQFPIDKIKIDQSFVKQLNESADSKTMIRAIIMIAKSLNMSIVAEGVETDSQLDILRSLSTDEVQGYFMSVPASVEDTTKLLNTKLPWPVK